MTLASAALALTGCGVADEQAAAPSPPAGDWGPSEPGRGERARPVAPPRRAPSAAAEAALAAGSVGVVGVDGAVGVRPRTLAVAGHGMLQDLRWRRWNARSAEGAGTLRMPDCDPTCAAGGIDEIPATVTLSSPRPCGRAAYFDRAVVAVADAAPPTTYVRAPC